MSGKKVSVKLKSGRTIEVFDFEVKNLEKQGLVAKEKATQKEEKQTPKTKENKQAKKTK